MNWHNTQEGKDPIIFGNFKEYGTEAQFIQAV